MSTFLETKPHAKPIKSIDDLRGYFQAHAKPAGEEKIGIECEIFGVHKKTGEALSYHGPFGIELVLKELAYEFGYQLIHEGNHVIALQKGNNLITLEPGGQVELSAEPVKSIHEAKKQLDEFFFQLRTIAQFVGPITWIASGIQPFTPLKKIEWVPKTRYKIMASYLGKRGKKAHDMMKRTATNQINLDYHSEQDAIDKMRLSLAITPIAAAMFANSSISGGRINGFQSERLNIWRHTDPARSGLILKLMCGHCSFNDYLNFVLNVPMMFIVRNAKWVVAKNLTFRKFIEKGYQDHHPTQTDFELHLSTIFTDARFKQYMEIRGMDGQRSHLIPAVFAFWKGILYDQEARQGVAKLMKGYSENELHRLHRDVEKLGLKAKLRNDSILELARHLVKISEKGLIRQDLANDQGQDESIFLAPLHEEILKEGKTPADRAAELWNGMFKRDRESLIDFMKI